MKDISIETRSYLRDYLNTMWSWDEDYATSEEELRASFASQNELRRLVGTSELLEDVDLQYAIAKRFGA